MIDLNSTNTAKGSLYKWTNYIKGYQKRWFVLQNGLLSYYRTQSEVTHTCRGTINLANAKITSTGSTTFLISNSSTQTFHLKATNEIEQKKWVAALTMGKAQALAVGKPDEDSDEWAEEDDSDSEWKTGRLMQEDAPRLIEQSLTHFAARISDLQHYQDTLKRKTDELQKSISELEAYPESAVAIEQFYTVKDRVTVCKVASMAMVNSCADFLAFTRSQSKRWQRCFTAQMERRGRLEQLVEDLAKQLRQMEMQARSKNSYSGFYFPGAIPGQAVAVSATPKTDAAKISPNVSDSKLEVVKPEASRGGTLTAGNTQTQQVKGDGTGSTPFISVGAMCSSDEDDFFDVEDIGTQFNVTLPGVFLGASDSATGLLRPRGSIKLASTIDTGGRSSAGDQTSSLSIGPDDGASLHGAEVAMEYESDVGDFEVPDYEETFDETFRGSHGNQKQTPKEARVIQKYGWGKASSTEMPLPPADVCVSSGRRTYDQIVPIRKSITRRRSIPPRPNISLNLWSILKNCIGKELTKIAVPVNFSEPLSMLQRLTESFEYSECLDRAAACTNPLEQLAHVAAFTISSYACTANRVNKPFNPLLSETFECDRTDDFGWRSLAEQVSHHPPIAALHCESNSWYTWFDFSMSSKFRGKYLQIDPIGVCHLVFRQSGHHYTWNKIPLTVHNIIVGRLWIDNSGVIDVTNHTTGDQCRLTVKPYSFFSSDPPRRVTGAVSDSLGNVRGIINGTWHESIEYAPVISSMTDSSRKPVVETGPAIQLWHVRPLPPDAEKMYNLTDLALQLNDPSEIGVAPTDCRLRPDQRLMEDGRWDEANMEKVRLEEKQRARRRQMAVKYSDLSQSLSEDSSKLDGSLTATAISPSIQDVVDKTHEPIWFERILDKDTNTETMMFKGTYWDCKAKGNWSMCPDIY